MILVISCVCCPRTLKPATLFHVFPLVGSLLVCTTLQREHLQFWWSHTHMSPFAPSVSSANPSLLLGRCCTLCVCVCDVCGTCYSCVQGWLRWWWGLSIWRAAWHGLIATSTCGSLPGKLLVCAGDSGAAITHICSLSFLL